MAKSVETSFGNYFKLPNPGLRSYFARVREGSDQEVRTPFYKGRDLDEILDPWIHKLATIQEEWPTLYEFEIDLSKKVGPMSIMFPLKERLDDIASYYDSISLESKPIPTSVLVTAQKEWAQVAGLRLRSQTRVVELMKKSTNSGSPFFTKRKSVITDSFPCEVRQIDLDTMQKSPGWIGSVCAVLGWRGQEGGREHKDVKQRVVWMFPFSVNIAEMQVYQPLIETAQRFNVVPAWVSMDAVDDRVTKLFDTKDPNDLIVCTDFEKFDQHFNSECQRVAQRMLQYLFTDVDAFRKWIVDVYPIKFAIPLAIDDNRIIYGDHGMASGSGGTNVDETLLHRVLQHYAANSNEVDLNENSQCLGDDGIISYPGITVEQVTQVYTSVGLKMNESKQYASAQDCTFLKRWYHTNYRKDHKCVGVYSTCRALGRLAEQERYYDPETWSKEMVALRQLSIIENCKHHPLREEFADYCMKGDIYRLGIDIPGFLDDIKKISDKAIEHMPDFLGYTKSMQNNHDSNSGIENWWIVQYLKSKR